MAFPMKKNARAAGCLALALALPLGMAGCAAPQNDTGTAPAATTANDAPAATDADGAEADAPESDAKTQVDQQVASVAYYDGESTEPVKTTYTYDEAGRLTAAEDSAVTQKWTYDDGGRLVKEEIAYAADEESEGGQQTTTYTYDDKGTLVERIFEDTTGENLDYETGEPMTDPDTGAVLDDYKHTYAYEDGGKKMTVTVTNADGQWTGATVYTFAESAEDLSPVVSVKPEELGAVIDPWKPITEQMVDQEGAVLESSEYTYNEAGDVTKLVSSYDDGEGTEKIVWTSTYDDKGHETMTTVAMEGEEGEAQETPTEWTYNEAGQATEKAAFDPFFGMTYEFYTYDSTGRLKSIVYVQPQDGGDHLVGCQVFDYAEKNEDLSQTPQQLMEEAAAKVPAQEATGEDELSFEEGEEIDLSDLEGLDMEGADAEDLALEDVEGSEDPSAA